MEPGENHEQQSLESTSLPHKRTRRLAKAADLASQKECPPPNSPGNEDYFPTRRVVRIPCKIMLGIMLDDLGLPKATYRTHTHKDGEYSAVVAFYSPSHVPGKFLQQFKMGGAHAVSSEMAEDSAAREGIRHLENWEKLEIEDLHYSELMYQHEQTEELHSKLKEEQKNTESLRKELSVAAETMVAFATEMYDLTANNRSLGQGGEAENHNAGLRLFETLAARLQQTGQEIKTGLKGDKKLA